MDGLSLDALIVYLTLANLQAYAVAPYLTWFIPSRFRSGAVFFDLIGAAMMWTAYVFWTRQLRHYQSVGH